MKNKLSNFWFNLSDKIRFLLVGGFNASVSYFIFLIICLIIGENHYQIALALSWAISSVISFITQKSLVFNIEGNPIKQYFKCCATWVFSYMINAGLLEISVKKLAFNVFFAQVFAAFCCAIFTYIMFKLFAFRNKK